MTTRSEQLADAFEAVATANHYMVGIVDPQITSNEIDDAEQILIARQNATNEQDYPETWKVLNLALDLLDYYRDWHNR